MTVRRVSPADAQALVDNEGYVHVDVRSEPEFAAGHPAGAFNIPFKHRVDGQMVDNPDFFAVFEAKFPTNAKVVLGCRSGGRSLNALKLLEARGYTNLVDQRAGFEGSKSAFGETMEAGWRTAGLPVSTDLGDLSYETIRASMKEKLGS